MRDETPYIQYSTQILGLLTAKHDRNLLFNVTASHFKIIVRSLKNKLSYLNI